MRVAFCGKGGSGKTSLAALFTRYVVERNYPTLAIDGDINQHLGDNLFLPESQLKALPRLGEELDKLQAYVLGNNAFIANAEEITESTPAGRGSNFVTLAAKDPIGQHFMLRQGNLRFVAMGGHTETDIGATCYHKFTGALGTFLNHLLDDENEIVVSDMCAGADPFASSGLASRFDALFLVCEPTKKSLAVFDQAVHYSQYHDLKLFVIGNKIENEEDESFIKNYVGNYYLTGFKGQLAFKKAERGTPYQLSDFDEQALASLAILLETLKQQVPRDWEKYQRTGLFFHKRASDSWASALYGRDLTQQIDPEFDYRNVMPPSKEAA
jgi:CO dehydrogenase maturation factor